MNKYIDRQLFLEVLEFVGRYQSLLDCAYLGMGGGFLEDFRVIHQAFGICKMLSFDLDEWVISRQLVNRPYGFVQCETASSTEIIDRFDAIRTEMVGPDGKVIVWLDYTQPGDRRLQLEDLEGLVGELNHGDVFRITLNANRSSLETNDQYQFAKQAGRTKHPTLAEWWHDKLVQQLDDYMPAERNDAQFLESESEFVITLIRAIKRSALNGLTSRPELIVEPLLAVTYADGQRMMTFSGLVLRADQRDTFRQVARWAEWPYQPGENWDWYLSLAVPHLSIRERQQIHGKMYSIAWPFAAQLVDFRLAEAVEDHTELVGQYLRHYHRYPTFAPFDIL